MKMDAKVNIGKKKLNRDLSADSTLIKKAEYFGILAVALLVYGLTCAPAVLWQDSGLFTYRVIHNDLVGNLGLALSHPLYMLAAISVKAIPWGDLAHKVNLVSAVFAAVAIANVYVLIVLIVRNKAAAGFAAATLGLSWTFWQHATIAEAYTMYAATLTAELIFLVQYFRRGRVGWLYALAIMNGLSISNHMWGTLPLACYLMLLAVLLRRRAVRWSHAAAMAAFWTAGASLYLSLIVIEVIKSGDLGGTLMSAAFGAGWQGQVLNASVTPRIILENFIFIGLNFPSASIVVLGIGLLTARRKIRGELFWTILAMMALFFAFAFRYTVPDRHAFFLPVYVVASVFVGAGFVWVMERFRNRWLIPATILFALLPIAVYAAAPSIARRAYPSLAQRRQIPYRDDLTYWLQPWQMGNYSGQQFASEALRQVEEGSMIYADSTTAHTLLYMQQVYGIRPDVMIVSRHDSGHNAVELDEGTVDEIVERYGLWVVTAHPSYCPNFILERFRTTKDGVLYRVTKDEPQAVDND